MVGLWWFTMVESVKNHPNQSKICNKQVVKLPLVVWVAGETPKRQLTRTVGNVNWDNSKSWAEFGWLEKKNETKT